MSVSKYYKILLLDSGLEKEDFHLLTNSDIAGLTTSLPLQMKIRRVRDQLVSRLVN